MSAQLHGTADGLEGVVAAATRLSMVDGERGELIIAGHRLEQLSAWPFEQVVSELWKAAGVDCSGLSVAPIAPATLALLEAAAARRTDPMDALRMAIGTLAAEGDLEAAKLLIGSAPTVVAAYARLLHGQEVLAPRPGLGVAANFLYMLTGAESAPALVSALDTYLATVSDHGLNASTFAA